MFDRRKYYKEWSKKLKTEFESGIRERAKSKTCCKCKQNKSSSEFHEWNYSLSGLSPECKLCNKTKVRALGRKKFGSSEEDFEKRFKLQNSKCGICGIEREEKRAFSLDHDHKTGRIRGILCTKCNLGLGYFSDNKDLLSKAVSYLEKNNGENECKSEGS